MQDGYIKSLDGVRAVSVIMTMSYHANLLHFAWISVQLFFVLSGFLITGILWKEKFREAPLSFKFKKFWVRRSLRIFPLYFGYLAVLGIAYLVVHFPSYYGLYAPYAFTYTLNYTRLLEGWQGNPLFTHLWTLSIEEQFYLLFPIILFLCPPRLIKTLLVAVLFLSPLSRYLLGEYYKANLDVPSTVMADAVYWNTLSHLDAFCIGGLIPVLSLEKWVRRPRRLLGICLLLALCTGLASYFLGGSSLPLWQDWGYQHMLMNTYQHVWQYTCINLCCAALILALVSPHAAQQLPLARRFFEQKWMVRIGKVSYGMYVFHWLVLVYLYERFLNNMSPVWKVVCFVPYVATVYLLAEASYSFYESYFIGLKDRVFKKKQKPQSPALTEAEAEAFKPM